MLTADGSRDDYGGNHGNEPGDPSDPNHAARQKLPIAPPSVKVERLPDPLTEVGEPLSIEEAREAYLRTQHASWNADSRTSKYERHRYHLYPRILAADRHFQSEYEGLTTAMLSRRLSPIDESGNWLTPWECNDMLHGGRIHQSIREAVDYQLDGFSYEWVGVTAPTRSAGTPHEHLYFWIDDPDDEVTTEYFDTGLERHLDHCVNAYQKHHQYRADGSGGAITVQHSPEVVKEAPDKIHDILEESTPRPNTMGAQYLASQLAHLPLGDFYDESKESPPDALLEGAALSWASPRNWFRASRGVPAL